MTSTFGSSQILILLAKLLFTSETLILALAQLGPAGASMQKVTVSMCQET
jgi:hypothetical protein